MSGSTCVVLHFPFSCFVSPGGGTRGPSSNVDFPESYSTSALRSMNDSNLDALRKEFDDGDNDEDQKNNHDHKKKRMSIMQLRKESVTYVVSPLYSLYALCRYDRTETKRNETSRFQNVNTARIGFLHRFCCILFIVLSFPPLISSSGLHSPSSDTVAWPTLATMASCLPARVTSFLRCFFWPQSLPGSETTAARSRVRKSS